ncbi:hypothetical protein FC696_05045 [Bacillus wiedmannii]|uniref:Uncharacterized protein n=1 Tax=Bacillus wiedmannii TaxID=1890302 RepID=A0ABX5DY93_9BACI|nr:hypothetical protein C6356_06975 [Bacillus wiedmannii]PRT42718.1 hypothetical protein C6357_01785 [Bacillus wiedmannii]TKI15554.1 hypothetical protein FC696_05045 [Bacillus wiedmannii]
MPLKQKDHFQNRKTSCRILIDYHSIIMKEFLWKIWKLNNYISICRIYHFLFHISNDTVEVVLRVKG